MNVLIYDPSANETCAAQFSYQDAQGFIGAAVLAPATENAMGSVGELWLADNPEGALWFFGARLFRGRAVFSLLPEWPDEPETPVPAIVAATALTLFEGLVRPVPPDFGPAAEEIYTRLTAGSLVTTPAGLREWRIRSARITSEMSELRKKLP